MKDPGRTIEPFCAEDSANGSWCELDSFYSSRILICLKTPEMSSDLANHFTGQGFENVNTATCSEAFFQKIDRQKHDLIIFDHNCNDAIASGYSAVQRIREIDADVALILISDLESDVRRQLELTINGHFSYPIQLENLIKASKKALGDKISYEIGMQFFDALFGMQMCTHRDLHQRTFDHVIRTTKVYGKFLLYLNARGYLHLTSWALKNCLMASLVHDIGKLLVMHGVLYKDGKLTDYEYLQIKRHPWNSITALLGGQDIEFFASEAEPVETVSGYNEKNLGAQVQKWVFKIFDGNMGALEDVEHYFNTLSRKPFIHSLNKDLLYIVFRHHDGLTQSYHTDEELDMFGRIISRQVSPKLSPHSKLDIVTNALSLCDMYDALLDTKRDYRKASYCKFFALYLLYDECKREKFFPFLVREFIKFVIENEELDTHAPFSDIKNGERAYLTIQQIHELFRITKDQEGDLNDFLIQNRHDFETFSESGDEKQLLELHARWISFHDTQRQRMLQDFLDELKKANLINKDIADLTLDEIKVFDLLYTFYYSYASSFKQKMLINYLVETVLQHKLTSTVRERLASIIMNPAHTSRKDIEKAFVDEGFERNDLFEVFSSYNENLLINELNEYLRRSGH